MHVSSRYPVAAWCLKHGGTFTTPKPWLEEEALDRFQAHGQVQVQDDDEDAYVERDPLILRSRERERS